MSQSLVVRPDHVRIGYHAYWRSDFTVTASSMREAEIRVLAYADATLGEDLRQGFTRAIIGNGLSADPKVLRYQVDLYILDRDWIPDDLYYEQWQSLSSRVSVCIP